MADRKTYYDVASDELNKKIDEQNGFLDNHKRHARGAAAGMAASGLTLAASIKLSKNTDKKIDALTKKIEEERSKEKSDVSKIAAAEKSIKKLKTFKAFLKGAKVGSTAGLAATGAKLTSNLNNQSKTMDRINKYQKEKDELDATEKRRKEYSANRKAVAESVTLYEAMNYINDYLIEKAHEVNGEKVNGTAARIALTKANQEAASAKNKNVLGKIASKANEAKLRNDSEKFSKGVGATSKEYNKAIDDSEKAYNSMLDAEKGPGKDSPEYKKALASYMASNSKAGLIFNNRAEKKSDLRALKRDYVDYPGSKKVRTIPGKYTKLQDKVREANAPKLECEA